MKCPCLKVFCFFQAFKSNRVFFAFLSLSVVQVDEGWYLGECHGKFGLFPANYVAINK